MTAGQDTLFAAETAMGYSFADRSLLVIALTHPSHAMEHRGESYERLEFLGDSVLGFIVAEELFRTHPDAPEGDLTNRKAGVVTGETLAEVAGQLGLGELLLLGKGEARSGRRGRASRLENAFEALIGAIYLDGGLDAAREVVLRLLGDIIDSDASVLQAGGAKSLLQSTRRPRWARCRSTGSSRPKASHTTARSSSRCS